MQSPENFDVAIVGGGLVGRISAWRLARSGRTVVVLNDVSAARASSAAAGMLAPSFEGHHHRAAPTLRPLLETALARWASFGPELADAADDDLDFQLSGIIGVDPSPGALDGSACPVPTGICAERAVLVPDEGQVDPRRTLAALESVAATCGVQTRDEQVVAYQARGGSIEVTAASGFKCRAQQIVLAVGAFSTLLPDDVPRPQPVRGRAFRVRPKVSQLNHVVRSSDVYFCPKADGTLYVGATEEISARKADAAALGDLWDRACARMPALATSEVVSVFDGLRPASPNGLPIIEPIDDNVVLATGLDRNGVLLAPWCVDQVIAMLEERAALA